MSNTRSTLRLGLAGAIAGAAMLVFSASAFAATPAAGPDPDALPAPALSVADQVRATPTPVPYEEDRRILRGDQFVMGDSFTLRSDETLRGDLTVFGGNAMLEEGSRVEGNVSIFGGNATIAGTVTGDLSMIGGSARLASSARIQGDLSILGGSVTRDPGAVVEGQSNRYTGPRITTPNPIRSVDRWDGPFRWVWDVTGNFVATLAGIFLITVLSIAAIAIFPANAQRAERVIRNQWLLAGAIGVLTYVAVPILIVILTVLICTIPAAIALALALAVLVVCGWAVVARMVGEWLMNGFKQTNWTTVGQTAAGAVLLAVLGAVPLIGWLVGFAASAIGMGALILTVAGTQDYPRPAAVVTAPVAPASSPASPGAPMTPSSPATLPEAQPTTVVPGDEPPATDTPRSDEPKA